MATKEDAEEERLRSVALQNAQSILVARRRAEEELRRQSEWLRVTLASIGEGVISTDAESKITFMNGVAEALTGWQQVDALGRPLPDVFHIINEHSRQAVENPALRALREGVIVGLANHTILIAKDRTERPIDDSAAPIRNEQGEVAGVVLVFRDIAERRQVERALQDSATRKTAMFETALDCIISMDHEGIIVEFNAAAERTFGYRRQDVLGRELAAVIIPPAYRERHRQAMAHYLATGEGSILNHRLELSALRADGAEFPVELTVTRVPVSGSPLFTAYLRDITERKRAENAVREHERRFRTMVEQVQDYAIFMINTQGRATSWNEGVKRVLGFEEAEFIGQDIAATIFLPEDVRSGAAWRELEQAAATGRAGDDRWMRRKNGERFFAFGVTSALRDGDGNLLGFMKVMRDQTHRKQMEDELRRIAAELSDADRRKNEFLAMLAHELRNPLAPIRNAVQVMQLSAGDKDFVLSASELMGRQVRHMVQLVDDLLDVSRISRGKINLRREQVGLSSLIANAVETSRPAIESARHTLTVSLPPQPVYLDADPVRLGQVFCNLLNNSCKYSEPGGHISLTASLEGMNVAISVKDTGVGIPAEMLPKIFEMFMQVDRSLERSQGGLGIGLTLVQRLVEMHDGSVSAFSEGPGRGSEFVVRLPVLSEPSKTRAEPTDRMPPDTARRILVVDDNRDSATSLAMLLKMKGNATHTAFDGQSAVEAAEAFLPDVVLLDIGLPKLNGYEAARQIRKQPWGEKMVLVALTGWGQEEDRQKSKEAGFNGHMLKPNTV